jgi:hypothetical protein
MIEALLLRLGISRWAAIAALSAVAAGAALLYSAHLVDLGVAQESARRDQIERVRDVQAKAERDRLNGIIFKKQAALDAALATIANQGKEIADAQNRSAALQSDLAAGRRWLSVAIAGTCRAASAGPDQGAGAAGMGAADGPATASLDGRVAADLEWLRQTRSDAIAGLQACVAAYDAVKAASDSPAP